MSIDSIKKLKERLGYYKAGEEIDILVARADDGEYKEITLRVTLDSREGTPLDESQDDSNTESDSQETNPDSGVQDSSDGRKEGEINIGGSEFSYSVPDDIFKIFGW